MTYRFSAGEVLENTRRDLYRQFAAPLALERTRLLYQGSLLPTLFMFLNGLVCAWLLWGAERYLLVWIWLGWLSALVCLRVIQVAAFEAAPRERQAQPVWRRMFLMGACVSGLTLAAAAVVLVPVENFQQQAWVFGLIGAATLSASVAYAVSISAFLVFSLSCLLPPILYLFWGGDVPFRGWGWLGLILLFALSVVAWQVNRLLERSLLRRFQNQALIEHLQQAQATSDALNTELAHEIDQRREAERGLREAQIGLEDRVAQRTFELEEANQALSKSPPRLAATVFDAASEGIVIFDPDYCILTVNQAFSRVSGYLPEDVIGRRVTDIASSRDARRHFQAIHQSLEQTGQWQGELVEARKNGELYPQWLQLNVVLDKAGKLSHIVGFFSDLSSRRAAEERMRYLAHFDELTGLANRSLFNERLREARERVRSGGRSLALLHINLDRFKLLNESLGHEIADQLLRHIARRLSNAMPEADTIARLSGDEFAVLFDGYSNLSSLARVTSRLLGKLRVPLSVAGHELVISASVGISLLSDSAREVPALVSQANMAMQHAKHLGGNNFQFFTQSLQASTLERLQLEIQLRRAVDEQQLQVFYQPKLCLRTGRLDSAEALVRWHHPQRGMVAPGEFIGLAEETGLISAIGEFVLRKACWQACEWQRQGMAPIRVSVNLSVHQLRQGKLVSLVRQVLEETGLAPQWLELELTESQLLDSVEHIITTFQQLRDLGVKLAIDDFGTGYSSLSYLRRFPVDYVKIDRAFISGLGDGTEDAAIIQAIISMAHSLGLKVVAEGVENQSQLEFLRSHGCDEVQGYLISRPIEATAMAGILLQSF
ncbi:putative bifunctional diguanylate cyclase/phosphodiesterase [Pseudomonas viridiflava]|uniref:putative bifunctional diguanylate cyclase/phosphodiesterase n=1 Tax=Pseudomonas viridiflava TaxID=33069 RepID=UPI000F03E1B5|nr:EAL domain-containing protein [Pseudomonas viridiflava]MEE3924520.1 EAL domain-containing protein [Pseudomonas viridiflava]MEE3930877.1 EAL domain-containing protein [Pseudomonas viridiflava]MEE3941611.1 EAL domain-containing protein [Pseudomonas viridiflava]MEE3967440.1 EAL domain-containing protein [Pseudomonas viridiflava]MEE3981668.1 EAL domain-containing protein [Pseudomonas viridiflava]